MRNVAYVLGHIAYFLASLGSRTVNAALFGGSMHQTLSARAHIEGRTDARWRRREAGINRLFLDPNHCAEGWCGEVDRARKTLEQNEATRECSTCAGSDSPLTQPVV